MNETDGIDETDETDETDGTADDRARGTDAVTDAVRVSVAADQCVGSGYCQRIAPEVFDLDGRGLAFVVRPRPTGAAADAAREAETNCPSLSITVLDG